MRGITMVPMLVVLPPSETKATGGSHPAVDFSSLSFGSLNSIRERIAADLVALSANREAAMETLKLGPRLADEVTANAALLASPTMPALERYTGVLYDALSPQRPAGNRPCSTRHRVSALRRHWRGRPHPPLPSVWHGQAPLRGSACRRSSHDEAPLGHRHHRGSQ